MRTNTILGAVALVLMLLSAMTYHESVTRAERFERGQKFLQNLNPDEIAQIVVKKGDDEVRLRRQGEEFTVSSAHGYPAANESVNKFVRDVLDLGLEKKVGAGESLEEELGLTEGAEDRIEVAFVNGSDQDMVRFVVAEAADGGASGSYVVRTDGDDREVYLSSSRVYLRTQSDDFLKKDVVDVKKEDVVRVVGPGYELVNTEGSFKLTDLPEGQKETTKADQTGGMLGAMRFSKHYLADAPEVQRLAWDTEVAVYLNDGSYYVVAVAQADDKHYLRILADHTAQQVAIAIDAGEEEVKDTADTLQSIDDVKEFNAFHGSWVYEVTEWTAKKFRVARDELTEDA